VAAPPDAGAGLWLRLERALDRAFGAAANPLRNLGTLGFLFFWVLAVTGIYLYVRFDTSIAGAYGSIDHLSRAERYFGGLVRSVHRYSADAFIVVTLAHLAREWAAGRFRRFRAFTWISGVPLVWLLYASGIVGCWLVWDARAQFSAIATAEWLDALPMFGGTLVRNFIFSENVNDRLFSLFVFLHVGLPLLLLAGMWVHVQRLSRPRTLPPRALALGMLAMLLALALAHPVQSGAPANFAHAPAALELDWFVLFVHPLMYATSPGALWILVGAATALLLGLPRLAPGAALVAARVSLPNCNGCGRCVADCPYQAVLLAPRSDGRPGKQAEVIAARCAACGICAGACPSSTPFRSARDLVSGIDLPDLTVHDLRRRVAAARAASGILVFACDHAAKGEVLARAGSEVLALPCIAMLPPSFVEYALRRGARGVFLLTCREGECAYRLGTELTAARFAGTREPHLRPTVPRARVREAGFGPGEEARALDALDAFALALANGGSDHD
jgi:ferredoxin/coenzyme F420-reducing hydrogenase delta subunit